jgi:ferredoxin-NADP reductase
MAASILTEVIAIEQLASDIKAFTLKAVHGALPGFSSGSHIIVQMQDGKHHYANAYSLTNLSDTPQVFQIAVKRGANSRGGSLFMHEAVAVGSRLSVSAPANLFTLAGGPGPHLFIAGGIGITPFIAHMTALDAVGGGYQLHYAFRGADSAAFVEELGARQGAGGVHLYDSVVGNRLDVAALLAAAPPDAHVYVCGPQGLIDDVSAKCAGRLAPDHLHVEQFSVAAPAAAEGFAVTLARSGLEIVVGPDESILQAIERQTSVSINCLCREGYCGTCETVLLAGEAEHYDQYLDDEEKAAQNKILICVSRAKAGTLTLDL